MYKYLKYNDTPQDKSLSKEVIKIAANCFLDQTGLVRRWVKRERFPDRAPVLAPIAMIPQILDAAHKTKWTGHGGIFRTHERILEHFWWPKITEQVIKYVNACATCQLAKSTPANPAPLQSLPIPDAPNVRVHLDLMGPLKSTDENKYILVITDAWTKYADVVPLKSKTAEEVAQAFIDNWICTFSCPKTILTDNGGEFTNKVMEEITKKMNIEHKWTSPFHPQTNSSAESFNRSIIKFMKVILENDTLEWVKHLQWLKLAYNTTVHKTTLETPFALTFAFPARLPFFDLDQPKVYYRDDVATENFLRLRNSFNQAMINSAEAMKKQKEYYDKKTTERKFKLGEKVMLQEYKIITKPGENNKFRKNFAGPFKITDIISDLNVKIAPLNGKGREKLVHINRIKHFVYTDFFNSEKEMGEKEFREKIQQQVNDRKHSMTTRSMSKFKNILNAQLQMNANMSNSDNGSNNTSHQRPAVPQAASGAIPKKLKPGPPLPLAAGSDSTPTPTQSRQPPAAESFGNSIPTTPNIQMPPAAGPSPRRSPTPPTLSLPPAAGPSKRRIPTPPIINLPPAAESQTIPSFMYEGLPQAAGSAPEVPAENQTTPPELRHNLEQARMLAGLFRASAEKKINPKRRQSLSIQRLSQPKNSNQSIRNETPAIFNRRDSLRAPASPRRLFTNNQTTNTSGSGEETRFVTPENSPGAVKNIQEQKKISPVMRAVQFAASSIIQTANFLHPHSTQIGLPDKSNSSRNAGSARTAGRPATRSQVIAPEIGWLPTRPLEYKPGRGRSKTRNK